MQLKCINNEAVESQLTVGKIYEMNGSTQSMYFVQDDRPLSSFEQEYGKYAIGFARERFVECSGEFEAMVWVPVQEAMPNDLTKEITSFKLPERQGKSNGGVVNIDSHYNFNYSLSPEDIDNGYIKLDPYFVAKQWKLGSKDDTGILFHCFKLIARFGEKNPKEREILALYKQAVRLAELEGVELK